MDKNLIIKDNGKIILSGIEDARQGEVIVNIKDGEISQDRYDTDGILKTSDVVNDLSDESTDKPLSAAMGKALKEGIDALSPTPMDDYISKTAVKNDLITGGSENVLAAEQGKVLKESTDGMTSDVSNMNENKANPDGYYSTLTVGAAENLIGRGSVPANYTRRRSGGGSIGSGAAVLEEIQGNTLVWNQLVVNGDFSDWPEGQALPTGWTNMPWYVTTRATITKVENGIDFVFTQTNANYVGCQLVDNYQYIAGHTYFFACDVLNEVPIGIGGKSSTSVRMNFSSNHTELTHEKIVKTVTTGVDDVIGIGFPNGVTEGKHVQVRNMVIVDLTAMGLGPLTAAEFEALFPLNYYAYNTGSLLNLTATGLQTNGFNQWDEEWEAGSYDNTTGAKIASTAANRNKTPIPVFPSTTYFWNVPTGTGKLWYYDADMNFISGASSSGGFTFTTPANCRYLNFTKINSISLAGSCINLSDVNKNGTYEPYWSETKALPITTATSGGVAIFPDGEKSAGTAHDRYYKSAGSDLFDKAEKVIASVDMGDLGWSYYGSNIFMCNAPADALTVAATAQANIKSDTYIATTVNTILYGTIDKSIGLSSRFYVKDTAYSDADIFTAAMQGKRLYYEVATPTDYTLDTPFSAQYRVDNDGTETILPENTSTPTTSPIVADIRYPFDAAGTINHLPKNYTSKPTMDNILTAFKTAGLISDYDLEYNEEHENYDCDIEQ